MSRMAIIDRDQMTDDQRAACDEAVAGLRGTIPTPMLAWIRNPELARRAQRLGELLRYQTLLEPRLSELAILVCARHWTSHVEWTAHKLEALKAGVNLKTVDSIARRERPVFEAEDEAIVFDVSSSLLTRGGIGDDFYRTAENRLGERRLVELVALVGYYSLVALTLNAFELGVPEKLAPELLEVSGQEQGSG
jgi:4-carboxymuconolactone decarboxylase